MNDKIENIFPSNLATKKMNSFVKKEQINNIKNVNNKYEKSFLNLSLQNIKEQKTENKIEELYITKEDNNIISYYYDTIKYLKNSVEFIDYNFFLLKSKNYIPKFKYDFYCRNNNNYNEKYINDYNNTNNNMYNFYFSEQDLYNNLEYVKSNDNNLKSQEYKIGNFKVNQNINSESNNDIIEGLEKNIVGYLERNLKSQNNFINNVNCPPFVPSNYYRKESDKLRKESNDSSSKDKESDSTSAISEKEKKEENNFESYNKTVHNNKQNLEKVEYLVEMFGRKGWICKLCNNFNYETRTKCNRCGIMKKPKNIVDLNHRMNQNNKKGDWTCINCRNLNYSFRTVCNRCKIPKINLFLDETTNFNNKEIFQKFPLYSFSPSFNYFNNNVQKFNGK
jgi:hypothetical protein